MIFFLVVLKKVFFAIKVLLQLQDFILVLLLDSLVNVLGFFFNLGANQHLRILQIPLFFQKYDSFLKLLLKT